jgi:putative ABC transport system ATP-binding protein
MAEEAKERTSGPYRSKDDGDGLVVEMRGVGKTFHKTAEPVVVFEELDFEVREGEFIALMGPSGSGKSTLLNLIAGLDTPTKGVVKVAGQDLTRASDGELAFFRSRNIGFIFQSFNLLPVLTAVENVELPLLLHKMSGADRRRRAETALKVVGLSDRMGHLPRQLSGGQEQRVGIARAIVNDPRILVCDEPTGELDRQSADDVLELLAQLNSEHKKTIIMVTHDPRAADRAATVRHLDKGKLQ